MCEDDQGWIKPGPEVTRDSFLQWQEARRGAHDAHHMTNPVWEWLFRGRIDPYHARQHFKTGGECPKGPGWAGCRIGQSHTRISDGREIWIAGEHEDHYDPDFYIYNDVIVQHPDGRVQIFGYPASTFRPTDFHSATAVDNDASIVLIGSIGYPEDRREGYTQVYRLDVTTLQIERIESSGEHPGWIHKHTAELSEDGRRIEVSGGQVLRRDRFVENIDQWSLRLPDFHWTRLTRRTWPRFLVRRADDQPLHLWQYSTLEFRKQLIRHGADLAAELGADLDIDAYRTLFRPSVDHLTAVPDSDGDDAWRTKLVVVEGVTIRFVEDSYSVTLTVEGELRESLVEVLAADLKEKLSRVESAECIVEPIE